MKFSERKRDVAIVGVGSTRFGEHWDKSLKDLIAEAGFKAATEAGIRGKDVELIVGGNMSGGMFVGQEHIAALVADTMGLQPTPSIRVEAACASGSLALEMGFMAVASGMYDVVLVGGVEKMTDVYTPGATTALAGAMDLEWEAYFGLTFPGIFALIAQRYMYEYGLTREQLALVAVKNHDHGYHNPLAQFRKKITVEDVVNSTLVADPLRLLDCSPITDGAATMVLVPAETAHQYTDTPIIISGIAQASDTLSLFNRKDLCTVNATVEAGKQAFSQARISHKDVDLVEVHDCFTIAEILALEDLGFCKKGEAAKLYEEGEVWVGGSLPVNTDGGLKSAGHPVGATGIKQVIEIVHQLRGESPEPVQVKGAEIGVAHNLGGSGATVVVTVLKRGD
jgi:acetyl-CoA C-acetyltransferase